MSAQRLLVQLIAQDGIRRHHPPAAWQLSFPLAIIPLVRPHNTTIAAISIAIAARVARFGLELSVPVMVLGVAVISDGDDGRRQ